MLKPLQLFNRTILIYLLKFFTLFCIAYFGTIAWIGLTAPGNYYSSFIHSYLDYVSWLRTSLLYVSKYILNTSGYNTIVSDAYSLQLVGGKAIHIGYDCIGYGVMSFWLAFMIANKGSWLKKTLWIVGGSIVIWMVNITRISLFFVSNNKGRQMPFGLDNHMFFNICAYIVIFVMIYFYDRSMKKVSS